MVHEENDPSAGPSIAEPDFEVPVREATSLDFVEARILAYRIFDEYLNSGRRAELDWLPESREHLPRYLPEAETLR